VVAVLFYMGLQYTGPLNDVWMATGYYRFLIWPIIDFAISLGLLFLFHRIALSMVYNKKRETTLRQDFQKAFNPDYKSDFDMDTEAMKSFMNKDPTERPLIDS
jgi:hypothetical protein